MGPPAGILLESLGLEIYILNALREGIMESMTPGYDCLGRVWEEKRAEKMAVGNEREAVTQAKSSHLGIKHLGLHLCSPSY